MPATAVEIAAGVLSTVRPLEARLNVCTVLVPLLVTSSLPPGTSLMLMPFGPAVSVLLLLPANSPAPIRSTKLLVLAESTSMPLFERSVR